MKTRLLMFIAFALTVHMPMIYAPPEPDPESDFYYSDHVITGKITSSEIVIDPREDNSTATFYDTIIYQIQVTQWHKNPLDDEFITVYGTHFPNDVVPEPQWGVVEFEIGDMVYLYLDEADDGLHFREYGSYLIEPEPEQDKPVPENCGPGTILQDRICVADKDGYVLARIQWPDRCYAATHVGTVRVIEADNNFDSSKPDSFKIQVWSNHDKNHVLDITVTETGNNTNIFEGTIPFAEIGDESLQNRLYISKDITIMAKYADRTLPPNILYSEVPVTLGTKVKITPYDFPPSREYYDGKKIPYDPCVMQVLEIAKEKGQDLSWLNVEFPNPSQQVKSGLLRHEVVCKQGLTLIFSVDYLPACVMPDSIAKLFERGWITHHTASGLFPTFVKIHEDKFREPDKVIPLLFMNELIFKGIAYENQKTEYSNTDEGYLETTRVCSPLVSQNGSKFFISAVFHPEPFEITGMFIDVNPPDDCHKYWVTPTGFFLRVNTE